MKKKQVHAWGKGVHRILLLTFSVHPSNGERGDKWTKSTISVALIIGVCYLIRLRQMKLFLDVITLENASLPDNGAGSSRCACAAFFLSTLLSPWTIQCHWPATEGLFVRRFFSSQHCWIDLSNGCRWIDHLTSSFVEPIGGIDHQAHVPTANYSTLTTVFFCLVVVWFLFVLPQGPFSEDDVGDHDNSLRSTIKVTPGRKSNATVAVFLHFHLALAYEKTVADWTKQERWGRGGTSRDSHGTGRSVSDRVESYWTESGKIDQPAQRTVSRCSENQNTRASQAAAQPRRWWQVSCCAPTERRISWATWLAWKRNTVRPGILQHYWDGPRHPSLSFSLSVCPSVRV